MQLKVTDSLILTISHLEKQILFKTLSSLMLDYLAMYKHLFLFSYFLEIPKLFNISKKEILLITTRSTLARESLATLQHLPSL